MDKEIWREVDTANNYEVSNLGRVRNKELLNVLSQNQNQSGVSFVAVSRDGQQKIRSVALMVAEAFISNPYPEVYNSVVHLNGDKTNTAAVNLMWRPRWFVVAYHKQFKLKKRYVWTDPIENVTTGERFKNSVEASMLYGILDFDMINAIVNRTEVPFTRHSYRPFP